MYSRKTHKLTNAKRKARAKKYSTYIVGATNFVQHQKFRLSVRSVSSCKMNETAVSHGNKLCKQMNKLAIKPETNEARLKNKREVAAANEGL